MIKIAVCIPPEPGLNATLLSQCGVEYVVCHGGLNAIDGAAAEDQPWSLKSLRQVKETYEKCGFELAVWEGRPNMEKIKLGLPGRDEEIEVVCAMLRNFGELGIPVWCSMWMPILGVMRTSFALPTRAGAQVSGFNHAELEGEPLTEHGVITEDDQWENLRYFLERTVPTAEKAGVKMAMHPDDPPLSPIRGVARIMSSLDNYQRLIDLVPSEANGIGLCQGNFALMTDDLPAAIRHFGGQGKIHFVHFRDVRGTPEDFTEAFHDDGQTDLVECMRAYREVGYEGVLRPDHYPKMGDENFADEHTMARLFAIGYLKGIRESVYSE
ncbi:MAG: TIM barrel protein [Candidatus Latescibacteria bacterium]|nr:TIM barrel protein [Candidatus Latescibacterota bacterium]